MLGNISGEGFEDYVYEQINQRQKVYGASNRNPEQLLYLNGKTSWIRLISSVDIANEPYYKKKEGTKKLQALGLDDSYLGNRLAREFILFSGTSQTTGTNPLQNDLRSGVNLSNSSELKSTFTNAYGIGGNEFGLQPMPTLGGAEIRYRNRGSLREANLSIKCFNKKQFEIIETLYLRLGYTVLLEWGHSCYFDNSGNFQKDNSISLQNYIFSGEDIQNGHFTLLSEISKKRKESNGNYDALYAKVSNYSWSFDNGVYDINVKLISLGDIVESLKVNFLTPSSLIEKELTNNSNEESKSSEKIDDARQFLAFYKDHSDLSRLFYNASVLSTNENDLNKVVDLTVESFKSYIFNPIGAVTDFYKGAKELLTAGANTTGSQLISLEKSLKRTYSSNKTNLPIDLNSLVYNETAFLSVNYDQAFLDTKSNIFYIQFGALLEFITKTQLIYNSQIGGKALSPLINIDYFPNSNWMVVEGKMISSDPSICLVNPNIETLGLTKVLPPFKYTLGNHNVGALMNVYINTRFILEKLLELEDEKGDVNVYNLLKEICVGINHSLGNINSLTPFIDEETNTLKIIDESIFPNQDDLIKTLKGKSPNVVPLQLFGYDYNQPSDSMAGFVKNFGIKTEITNDLATTITIGAQATNKPIKGVDATAFGAWNRGLIDRIIPEKIETPTKSEEEKQPLPPTFEEFKKQLDQKYGDIKRTYRDLEQCFVGDGQIKFNWDNIPSYNAAVKGFRNYLRELNSYNTLKNENSVQISSPAFLPINLNLELEGISGPLILQKLEANTSFLPNPIPDTLSFLIKNISHKIQNNIWTTNYDTVSIPKFLTLQTEETKLTPLNSGEKPSQKPKPIDQLSNPEKDPAVIYFSRDKVNTNNVKNFYFQKSLNNGSTQLESKLIDFTLTYPNLNWVIKDGVIPKLHPEAAEQLSALYQAYITQFGEGFKISDSFRPLSIQEKYYEDTGGKKIKGQWVGGNGSAAKPGRSNHGWGGAIDISELWQYVQGNTDPELNRKGRIKSPEYLWLAQNGPKYGWYNPWKLCDYNGIDEMWHWEYLAGLRNS